MYRYQIPGAEAKTDLAFLIERSICLHEFHFYLVNLMSLNAPKINITIEEKFGILNQKDEAWTELTEQTEDTFFVGSSIESHATAKWRPSILR